MTRALALLRLELRLESRYRIHAVGLVLAAVWTALLLVLPPSAARVVAPFALFLDAATVGVFLLAGLVLFERAERSLSALLTSPATTLEYMGAKVVSLTALAVAISVPVALAGGRGDLRPIPVLAGVAATALLLLFLCFALVARHRSITTFLSVAPWPMIPLMAVPLVWLGGLVTHPAAFLVPTVPAAGLVAAGFDATVHVPAWAVVSLAGWVVAAGLLAARRFASIVRTGGG